MAAKRDLLRFITCGSVDDGKSTLIGRLLHDCGLIFEDTYTKLRTDSQRPGTSGDALDFALLLDGLEAERQQGITIDVAYRFFATPQRSFIVADTPGHEQYTRNMATGASTASLAIILVDATKGLLPQSRRHSIICSLLGIRHIVLAINKMDLVGFDAARFGAIVAEYRSFAEALGFRDITAIPVSARRGDNIASLSDNTPWYRGPHLLAHLEALDVAADDAAKPFRFPVQWVNRPNASFRGFAGIVASGRIAAGDAIMLAVTGAQSLVARIVAADGDLAEAVAGQAVTLTLADEIDIARGDMLVAPSARPETADQFAADMLWMGQEALLPGRDYLLRIGHAWTTARVTSLRHRLDLTTREHKAARQLEMNDIGLCHLASLQPLSFDPYAENRATGAFILVDRFTHETVAAGMIRHGLRRATNIHRAAFSIDKTARSERYGQCPVLLWFTGLSGSGKSTIANLVEQALFAAGRPCYSLDGDNLRHGLCRDLGFTAADRVENIRRAGEVAKLFLDAGLIVLASFISPFRAERQMLRELIGAEDFLEIHVDASLETCMARDPKGLYAKAKAGLIPNFTGISSPYEAPENPNIHLKTSDFTAEACAEQVLQALRGKGIAC
ncbi:MAG: sulfate adenylyltransferase subunit CysN [Roseomonas sp.]|nr:sulfate adenylyltransferase subunit CysN [Roseomonas sp.]MCA3382438.1 sulfate adenylyltransferase subunit CysN [Roseomonas sp.]